MPGDDYIYLSEVEKKADSVHLLNLYSKPMLDNSVREIKRVKIEPTNGLKDSNSVENEYSFVAGTSHYIDFSSMRVQLDITVGATTPATDAFDDNKIYEPGPFFWSAAELSLNGESIETCNNPGAIAAMKARNTCSREWFQTYGGGSTVEDYNNNSAQASYATYDTSTGAKTSIAWVATETLLANGSTLDSATTDVALYAADEVIKVENIGAYNRHKTMVDAGQGVLQFDVPMWLIFGSIEQLAGHNSFINLNKFTLKLKNWASASDFFKGSAIPTDAKITSQVLIFDTYMLSEDIETQLAKLSSDNIPIVLPFVKSVYAAQVATTTDANADGETVVSATLKNPVAAHSYLTVKPTSAISAQIFNNGNFRKKEVTFGGNSIDSGNFENDWKTRKISNQYHDYLDCISGDDNTKTPSGIVSRKLFKEVYPTISTNFRKMYKTDLFELKNEEAALVLKYYWTASNTAGALSAAKTDTIHTIFETENVCKIWPTKAQLSVH